MYSKRTLPFFFLCSTIYLTKEINSFVFIFSGKLRPQYISPNSQVAICSCLISIQLLLSLLWLAYERPHVDLIADDRLVTLKCRMNKNSFLYSSTYNVLLVLVCTMYAIRTRKVPEQFNETKFIGFTCYTTCIIWFVKSVLEK